MNHRNPRELAQEVTDNASDIRGSIVSDGDIEYIMNQTLITDTLVIKRHLAENNNNVPLTILSLLGLQQDKTTCWQTTPENTVFGEIRKILNEKESIYQDVMKANKNT